MKIILLTLLFINILTYINIIQSVEIRNIPWFMVEDRIYYIDTKPAYTSNEARYICLEKNMMYTLSLLDQQDVLDYIHHVYGRVPSLWTFDNDKQYILQRGTAGSCYKLDTRNGKYSKEDCETRMPFICLRNFDGASLYFVNGTHREIIADEVRTYCNPHVTKYDDILELCLIRYTLK